MKQFDRGSFQFTATEVNWAECVSQPEDGEMLDLLREAGEGGDGSERDWYTDGARESSSSRSIIDFFVSG